MNYYAMVNLQGFRSMVQAVGGLKLNVRDRIPIGGVGGPVTGHIEPGVQRLNGFQTLWFARSRESADDYSRMARQKCVMNAMVQQLSPTTVVTKFEDIAKASEKLVTTDLPASELGTFAELAMKARSQPIRTVSFVPPAVSTSNPDIDKIHSMVTSAVKRSESSGKPKSPAAGGTAPKKGFSKGKQSTVGGSIGNLHDGYAANASDDLSSSC
jgi:anionic cell wall polymer biosynthesis LytR-Cps2A-Psr (LCP) family protein